MKTALITGALGGLGQSIARRLAADGMNLVLTDLHPCTELAAHLRSEGIQVWEQACNLADDTAIEQFLDWANQTADPVDVLVNNAADQRLAPIAELELDFLRAIMRVNLEAPFLISKRLGLKMADRGWGRIVNLVSGSAWSPPPGFSAYITSKMALIGLTRAFAMELGDRGVTVNSISPALTQHANNIDALPDAIWDWQRSIQAIKRTAGPDDIVGFISFLCSQDGAFVTGQTLFANGGGLML